jgi:hypothetical protein
MNGPVWQLPAPSETSQSANGYIPASAKYHCFVDNKSLCNKYAQDTNYYDLGIESGAILQNPHFACKRCRLKWIKRYLPDIEGKGI